MKIPSHKRGEAKHVIMLVDNPCISDSRVIKSAEALVHAGLRVTVLCRHEKNLPEIEEIKQVLYQRLKPIPRNLSSSISWVVNRQITQPKSVSAATFSGKSLSDLQKNLINFIKSILQGVLKRLKLLPDSMIKRLLKRLWQKGISIFRKFNHLLKYPARKFLELNNIDEFTFIAYDHAITLRPDVVHCHDLATLAAGVKIANASGCKLVYDSHELEMHRNAKYSEEAKRKRRQIELKGIKRSNVVITVSESIANHLESDYKIRRPCVIMNAPDFDGKERPERTLRDDIGLSVDTPLAVYVGAATLNRGLDYMVKALVHFPELHFATVGPRHPATLLELSDLATKLKVDDRLHFIDAVPPSSVVGYISTADVSVLPIQNVCLSYYYCMPNKLLESVFSGIPVAVANLQEMRRFVETYQCGVVMDEKSPDSIASSIRLILEDPGRFTLTPSMQQQIYEKYSWTTQAQKLCSIYEELFSDLAAHRYSRP